MTAHYSAHASIEDKRRGMKLLSFAPVTLAKPEEEPERNELRKLIDKLPIEMVREMIEIYKKKKLASPGRDWCLFWFKKVF